MSERFRLSGEMSRRVTLYGNASEQVLEALRHLMDFERQNPRVREIMQKRIESWPKENQNWFQRALRWLRRV